MLVEVLITIAIIALVSGGVALAIFWHGERAKLKFARTQAETVRTAVQTHGLDGGQDCPDVELLIQDSVLDENSPRRDPWGGPWIITCEGAKIRVRSNGPDRQPGTEDDIQVPRP
jgi:type II secretory pathway pseudopilin PulG